MGFLNLLGVFRLGQGPKPEASLIRVCFLYGMILLLVPGAAFDSQATRDIAWAGYGHFMSIPFLMMAMISGYGLIANINGWSYSHVFRFCGALLGSFIWLWLMWKFTAVGSPLTFGSVCALVFLIDSLWVAVMALSGLPKPGATGAL